MRNLTLRDPSFLGASLLSVSNSPLLNIPFSVNRTLTDTVSGGSLITFSRAAATGTFIDSSGVLQTAAADTARFTTDPLTLVSLGLLGEEARTNLLLRSEEIGATPWGTNNTGATTYTANAITAPTGAATADRLTATADFAGTNQFASVVSGSSYSFSFYVKAVTPGSLDSIQIECFSGRYARFNITTRVFFNVNAAITPSFVSLGDGWVRVQCLFTAPSTGFLPVSIYASTSADFYLWGAQLEAGAFPASYISTTSATATRNADVADITSTNSALIGAIRTLFVEFRSPAVGTRGVISLNDGTANNRIEVRTNGTAVQVLIVTGGTTVTIAAGTITANARARLAVRIGAASSSASLNGAAPVTAAASRPTVDRAAIARSQANEYLNGTIATLTAWGQEFTDSMLVIQST